VKVSLLTIHRFRNMAQLVLAPGDGANIILGDNAQGKTNILEAIWLFSGAKSFRGAKDGDYIPFGGQNASLTLDFISNGREQTASIVLEGKKKRVSLNGINRESRAALAGVFCTVIFSPDHLSLIKQGPEHRRRMMDAFLSQVSPKYANVLDSYYRILQQRNTLLKDVGKHAHLLDTLDVWDKSLVEYGSYITTVRAGYVAKLAQKTRAIYAGISGEVERLEIDYCNAANGGWEKLARPHCREAMHQRLKECRREDIKAGMTTVGPHRDDIEILLNGRSARSFGSQGQQRSCVLALKLAECELLEEISGEAPVVLLDDVTSELDQHRRNYLLSHLQGKQVFITCCDDLAFAETEKGRVFRICAGKIVS
jgi:recF protein